MNETILLLEDEEALRITLSERLRKEGYVVEVASDAAHTFERATARAFDLIILDATLSGRNGIALCQDIRDAGLANPILVLTSQGQMPERVLALKLGADDCVPKPVEISELVARIEVLFRRGSLRTRGGIHKSLRRQSVRTRGGVRHFGAIRIDIPRGEVTREGKPVFLSLREFQLLRYLSEHAGAALTRADILRDVWGYEAGRISRTVDVHVAALRRKLEMNPKRPKLILTVPGIGYRFGG
jgi:two-component system alkaline phosphatase synthesis response regulator PhoP